MSEGKFITFEGGEATGKSTQIRLLADYLKKRDIDVIVTREPGGTPEAERVRQILRGTDVDKWDGISETLLLYAARRNHVEKVIKPALAKGQWVVCDRFADSTRVFQAYGRHVPPEVIEQLHHLTLNDFEPDLTIVMDVPPIVSLKRTQKRAARPKPVHQEEDWFECMDMDFHERIYQGYRLLAKRYARCALVDGTLQKERVHAIIADILYHRLDVPLVEGV